jgi:hypothetical protein
MTPTPRSDGLPAVQVSLVWAADRDEDEAQRQIARIVREVQASIPHPGVDINQWRYSGPSPARRRILPGRSPEGPLPGIISHPNTFSMIWANGEQFSPASQALGEGVSESGGRIHIFSVAPSLPIASKEVAFDWSPQMIPHKPGPDVTIEEKLHRALMHHCLGLKDQSSQSIHEWARNKDLPRI